MRVSFKLVYLVVAVALTVTLGAIVFIQSPGSDHPDTGGSRNTNQEGLTSQSNGQTPETNPFDPPCVGGNCEPRNIAGFDLFSSRVGQSSGSFVVDTDVPTLEEVLEKGLALAEVSAVHLAFRGTAQEDSVRCEWRGVARTPTQREEAIRFWLDLSDVEDLPTAADAERRLLGALELTNPHLPRRRSRQISDLWHEGVYRLITFS